MDNLKLFAKNKKELDSLVHAVRMLSKDTGMAIIWDPKVCHGGNESGKDGLMHTLVRII